MKLSYRNQKNAEMISAYWKKPLNTPDWWRVEAKDGEDDQIIVYDVIGWPFNDATELIKAIAGCSGKPVSMRINSPGGDVFDALAVTHAITAHGNVTTINDALVASAASYMFTAGKKRKAYKGSMTMIHEPWTMAFGNQFDMREVADLLAQISDNMVDMYADTTSVGKRELREMMKAGTWMKATIAKDKGFVDEIITGKEKTKAEFDLSMYANVPDELILNNGDNEPDKRTIEKALRDVGFSQNKAKAFIARGLKVEVDEPIIPIDNSVELAAFAAELRKGISALSA